MSSDPWNDLLLGSPRPFVEPQTGETVMEQPVIAPEKRKASGTAYVIVNMEALIEAGRYLNKPALLILMEAARHCRMGNGAVAITAAFCKRLGISRKQRRGAVRELGAFRTATGWVEVTQSNHAAARLQMTPEGMRRLWRTK